MVGTLSRHQKSIELCQTITARSPDNMSPLQPYNLLFQDCCKGQSLDTEFVYFLLLVWPSYRIGNNINRLQPYS